MPKVVLFMDNPMIPTGYASTCRLTAKELRKRGWEVYAAAFNGGGQSGPGGEPVFDFLGIKVLRNYALEREKNAIYGDADTILQIAKDIDPDIFFFHNDSYRYSYLKGLPKDILERSVFWLPFEGAGPDIPGLEVFGKCAAVRFVTKFAMDLHAQHMKHGNVGVIPHAVDMEHMRPCDNQLQFKASKQMGLESKFLVTRVDRHQPRKYWDLTIKAFAKFAKGKDDVFLLGKCNPRDITMWDPEKQQGVDLEALAQTLGVAEKVKFDDFFFDVSYMPAAFYWPADVFLTTTAGEGFGLALVEAMACGLPVVYPDTPVLPEVVGDAGMKFKLAGKEWYNKMSVWHNIPDVDDAAARLEEAYQDWKAGGKKLGEIGKRGHKAATEKYSPKAVYDQWDEAMRDVMEQRELVSVITVLYNVSGQEYLTGPDGVNRLKETMEEYVKHPYEWIIVDNGSPRREETRAWLDAAAAKNKRIKPVCLDVNRGFAGGNNVAISIAKGKHVVLCNPDSEVIPPEKHGFKHDVLRLMADRLGSDPKIGILGMELNRRDDVMPGATFPYFCCVMLSRPFLDAIRNPDGTWFDENFWPGYYEDLDVVIRARTRGFKVVDEKTLPFWHKSGGTNKNVVGDGGKNPNNKFFLSAIERLRKEGKMRADWDRKLGEVAAGGMQAMIDGNIAYLNAKWGKSARSKVRVIWDTHIGAAVGFSQIAEGLIPELHALGFDVYVNDWSNGSNIENPLIAQLYEKTKKAKESGDDLKDAVHIVCWLMETFLDVDAGYKVGISLCESTKVRESYLHACNSMDRILTFSEFCRGVQVNSGFRVPIHVIPPGVNQAYINYHERNSAQKDKYTFACVGVSQERKDVYRLVEAFCEAFPKGEKLPPECRDGFPLSCDQVELVLKSNNFGDLDWVKAKGLDKRANIRTIFTGWTQKAQRKDFSTQEMYDFYCGVDCLVHPSHGEGIGMPILEAAATGMPTIFTNWSSPSEYLDESNSFPCLLSPYPGTTMTQAYPGAPGDNGLWANIHIGHLKFQMYTVIRNRAAAREKGLKAHETIKEKYNWAESARALWPMIMEWDAHRKAKPKQEVDFDPATFVRPALQPVKQGDRVLVDVGTRDRHPYLSCLIVSLLGQTLKNWDIIIQVDDVDETILEDQLVRALLSRCENEGHNWRMIRSQRQGPHMAHQRTLQMAVDDPRYKYKLICRVDDDIYVKDNFLELLYQQFLGDKNCQLGAVAGVYLDPRRKDAEQMAPPNYASDINYAGKIDHNVPWPYVCLYPPRTGPRPMEHLYSTFMYRVEVAKAIGGYCKLFSQIGHREESDFSHRFFLAGYRLLVQPEAVGYHFSARGGIRALDIKEKEALAESDHKIYSRRLAYWKTRLAARQDKEKQASLQAKQEVPKPKELPKDEPVKVACVISAGSKPEPIKEAIKRFSEISDVVYVVCDLKSKDELVSLPASPKLAMVAVGPQEAAQIAKEAMAAGDHQFVLSVNEHMRFLSDPRPLLKSGHDEYVFEVYKTYKRGSFNGQAFVPREEGSEVIGPECRNMCLMGRKSRLASLGKGTTLDRIFYSDIMVLEDDELTPDKGASVTGRPLVRLDEASRTNWTKVCIYQHPEGRVDPPREADVLNGGPLVSIVIPTPGRRELLKKCLDTVYANTSTSFEVVVVDNGSSDGTREMLEEQSKSRPNISVIRNESNLGYQKAVNIAVPRSRGKYLLLFNDDAWVDSPEPDGRDWLRTLVDELESGPKVGLVGPHAGESPALHKPILYFWCVMLRRATWDDVGELDDVTFFNYGGDDDYCERLRAKGYEVRQKYVHLKHLMDRVPQEVKQKELAESRLKLLSKYQA